MVSIVPPRDSRLALALLLLVAGCKKTIKPEMVDRDIPITQNSRPWKIASARSAAPADVSRDAQVLDLPATDTSHGEELVLGASGWTCWPDDPKTPATDPVCEDEGGREWEYAVQSRRAPRIAGIGTIYRLQGGNSASDIDPAKRAPDTGQAWIEDPPYVGIVPANPRQVFAGLPVTRQKDRPWVRYAGTPWAYLFVPVAARR